jgi:hypothetical protein
MPRRPRLVGILWHWHRRVGLLAAVFVVVLAATGLLLNHASQLGLDRRFVDWAWLNGVYGDDSGELRAFRLGEQWLYRTADGRVYLDAREVAPCSGEFVGAAEAGEVLLAACAEELLVITRDGALLDSATATLGLPVPLQAIGLVGDLTGRAAAVQADGAWWLVDLEQMNFSQRAGAGGATVSQVAPEALPERIRARIPHTGAVAELGACVAGSAQWPAPRLAGCAGNGRCRCVVGYARDQRFCDVVAASAARAPRVTSPVERTRTASQFAP